MCTSSTVIIMAIWWKPDDISFFGTQCKYMYSVGLKRLDNNVQTGPIFLAHPVDSGAIYVEFHGSVQQKNAS